MAREPFFKRRVATPVEPPNIKRKPEVVAPTLKSLIKKKKEQEAKNPVLHVEKKSVAKPKATPKSKSSTIDSWKSKDKKYHIELTKEDGAYQIKVHTLNSGGRSTNTSHLGGSDLKQAKKEFQQRVKVFENAKPLVMTREEADRYIQKKIGPKIMSKDLSTEAKLAIFASKTEGKLDVLAKPKLIKKKRTTKQVTRKLVGIGKAILKKEARIKEKKDALEKEHQKIKNLKAKHHKRLGDHLNRIKEREIKKKGAINPPSNNKFNPADLAKAVVKKKK